MVANISRETLRQHLENDVRLQLVEALPLKYFEAEHLPGAINIDVDEVTTLAPKVLPDKDAMIVVYCASAACQNSTQVAKRLEALGYTNVLKYLEGKQDWIEAGLATFGQRAAA